MLAVTENVKSYMYTTDSFCTMDCRCVEYTIYCFKLPPSSIIFNSVKTDINILHIEGDDDVSLFLANKELFFKLFDIVYLPNDLFFKPTSISTSSSSSNTTPAETETMPSSNITPNIAPVQTEQTSSEYILTENSSPITIASSPISVPISRKIYTDSVTVIATTISSSQKYESNIASTPSSSYSSDTIIATTSSSQRDITSTPSSSFSSDAIIATTSSSQKYERNITSTSSSSSSSDVVIATISSKKRNVTDNYYEMQVIVTDANITPTNYGIYSIDKYAIYKTLFYIVSSILLCLVFGLLLIILISKLVKRNRFRRLVLDEERQEDLEMREMAPDTETHEL